MKNANTRATRGIRHEVESLAEAIATVEALSASLDHVEVARGRGDAVSASELIVLEMALRIAVEDLASGSVR